jgi:L-fuconolactonase
MFDPAYAQRNFPTIRPEWLARQAVEEVIDPAQPIVDPHHHLWDVPGSRYLGGELAADLHTGHDVRATVHVECKSGYRPGGPEAMRPLGETEFVLRQSAAAGAGACAAIVGWADLSLGAGVREVLEAHLALAPTRFRGVRVRAAWHEHPAFGHADGPPPDLLRQPGFRAGFAQLAPLGLRCDMWVFHTQLPDVLALARDEPGTTIVLNHCGGPLGIGPFAGKRREVFADWSRDLRALARAPNVVLKLGGLAMPRIGFGFDGHDRPPGSAELARAWQPYVDVGVEAFGPDRCMFESNFPVDKGMTGYRVLWNGFKRMAAGLSAAERDRVLRGTAASIYAVAA